MAKRNVLAIIIALTLCVSLCACTAEETSNMASDTQSKTGTFTVVQEGSAGQYVDQTIMYDSDTMVMYIYLDGTHSGTMSVLYNADGTLKLYSPNTKYETFTVVQEGSAGKYFDQTIMYDSDTMVMYIYLDGTYSGTMSVLYNADGTLKLYSPEH